MKHENKIYEIYYDQEGDFLEASFGDPAKEGTTEELEQGIFITREIKTGRITDIGILEFKKRFKILNKILNRFDLSFPLKINVD